MRYSLVFFIGIALAACSNLEGPTGPEGPQGEQGEQGEAGERGPVGATGQTLQIDVVSGTVLNQNYTDANPNSASIPLVSRGEEPTILFFGIENANGVYVKTEWNAVIWGGTNADFTVPGTSGYYLLVSDRNNALVNANYQVKFVQ